MSDSTDKTTGKDENLSNDDKKLSVDEDTTYLVRSQKRLAEEAARLSAEARAAEENSQVFNQFVDAFKKGQFAKLLDMRETKRQVFDRISSSDPAIAEFLEGVFLNVGEKCKEIAREYPALILEASQKEGLQIDQTSVHPKYSFCDRFITLWIDDKRFKAKAYTQEGNLFFMPFDISLVVPALKHEINRIFDRPFDPNKFVSRLYSNYCNVIKKESREIGDPIPIRKIIARLRKSQKSFRTDEFIIDLSRLVEMGAPSVNGYAIDLEHTKDDRYGILLHHLDSGYVGFMRFRKEEKI